MTHDASRLHGVIDMHIHSKPDVRERRSSDLELAAEAERRGLRAIVIKSHVTPTVGRAWLARQVYPSVEIFGGVTLNREVGGLNPYAVDTAIKMGAKIVWLPTTWAWNDRHILKGLDDGIRLIDGTGALVPELVAVLKLVKDADIALGLGHLSYREACSVAQYAHRAGMKKVIVNHPEWPTLNFSIGEQRELLRFGVYFERTFQRRLGGSGPYVSNFDVNLKAIREIGWQSTIISTDGGQVEAPFWGDAIAQYVDFLYDSGCSEEAVNGMTRLNPARMLGLEPDN